MQTHVKIRVGRRDYCTQTPEYKQKIQLNATLGSQQKKLRFQSRAMQRFSFAVALCVLSPVSPQSQPLVPCKQGENVEGSWWLSKLITDDEMSRTLHHTFLPSVAKAWEWVWLPNNCSYVRFGFKRPHYHERRTSEDQIIGTRSSRAGTQQCNSRTKKV